MSLKVQVIILGIGSDYGLVLASRQAIIWINYVKFIGAYLRHSTPMSQRWSHVDGSWRNSFRIRHICF